MLLFANYLNGWFAGCVRQMSARRFVFIAGLLMRVMGTCPAQPDTRLDKDVYTIVEKPPEFPGGMPALATYLQTNIQYPAAAKAANVRGQIYVQFVVRQDGRITDVDILKGLGYGCDEEARRVIRQMPPWVPGSQSGRPLNVKYTLPVLFGLAYSPDYPRRKSR